MSGKIILPPDEDAIIDREQRRHKCELPGVKEPTDYPIALDEHLGSIWQCCQCKRYWLAGSVLWYQINPKQVKKLIKDRSKQK